MAPGPSQDTGARAGNLGPPRNADCATQGGGYVGQEGRRPGAARRVGRPRGTGTPSGAGQPRSSPTEGTRIQKYLAHAGVAARRRAETEFIAAGRVTVDGHPVTDPGTRVRAGQVVRVDGRVVRPEAPLVLLVNKPVGVVSAAVDRRGRRTAVDLVADAGVRLYPVGRLDTDSEGLLLLTNDGAMTYALLHPRHRVPRVYCALVRPRPEPAALVRLEAGVSLSDGPARAEDVHSLSRTPRGVVPGPGAPDAGWISMALREGRNREARRMCAAVGLEVLRLVRTRFGGLHLTGLAPGEARRLSDAEIAGLWRDAGMRPPGPSPATERRPARPRTGGRNDLAGQTLAPGRPSRGMPRGKLERAGRPDAEAGPPAAESPTRRASGPGVPRRPPNRAGPPRGPAGGGAPGPPAPRRGTRPRAR